MAPTTQPLKPVHDERVEHRYATLNGRKYHYLYAEPKGAKPRATVFLVHGWPDISFGWRYQIPLLVDLGLRVVAPDLMGFGGSEAPKVSQDDLELYSQKRASDDFAELARQLGAPKIIIGGHDWGGAVVYRFHLWHPELVTHVFSVCTPYQPPTKNYVSLDMVVERAPQFGYQQHLAGPEVEANVTSRDQIRSFLNGMFLKSWRADEDEQYGGRTSEKKLLFSPEKGIDFSVLPHMGKSPLLTNAEIEYYTDEYARHGLHGTLNWYRTRAQNHADEKALTTGKIEVPVLFIQANKDSVLLPEMSKGMEKLIPKLARAEVNAGHWALWQAAGEVNGILQKWFEDVVFGGKSKL